MAQDPHSKTLSPELSPGAKSLVGLADSSSVRRPAAAEHETPHSEETRRRRREIADQAIAIEELIDAGRVEDALAAIDAIEERYGHEAPVDFLEAELQESVGGDPEVLGRIEARRNRGAEDAAVAEQALVREQALLQATAEIEDLIRLARFREAEAAITQLEQNYPDEAPVFDLRGHLESAARQATEAGTDAMAETVAPPPLDPHPDKDFWADIDTPRAPNRRALWTALAILIAALAAGVWWWLAQGGGSAPAASAEASATSVTAPPPETADERAATPATTIVEPPRAERPPATAPAAPTPEPEPEATPELPATPPLAAEPATASPVAAAPEATTAEAPTPEAPTPEAAAPESAVEPVFLHCGDPDVWCIKRRTVPAAQVPPELSREDARGSTVVRVLVGTDGTAMATEVLESSGSAALDAAALEAASRATFWPATLNRVPGLSWENLVFDFDGP